MNRSKSPLRRALAITAGALIGLTGTVILAGPASAQAAPDAAAACVNAAQAKYVHEFNGPAGTASVTLTNGPLCAGQEQEFALVSYIAPSAKFALPQYAFDRAVQKFAAPKSTELVVSGSKPKLTFEVKVPSCYTQVDLVRGSRIIDPLISRNDLYGDRKLAAYNGGRGTCVAAPEAEVVPDCAGNVTVKLVNRKGNAPATFEVTADGNFSKTVKVGPGKIESVTVPAANAKNILVKADGKEVHRGGWQKPKDCEQPGQPQGFLESTCDALIIGLKNPAGGKTITLTLTPNKGAAQTLVIKGGEEKSAKFTGVKGLTVTPSIEGVGASEPIAWAPPKDCVKPTPTPTPSSNGNGGGDGGTLPVTGTAAGGIAGGAAGLLAIGAVLFMLARRRRVRFTA
ncbi:MAG TPA: LPXTG cell wall anchor domain-containing protein [Catenuloplanes sp.]